MKPLKSRLKNRVGKCAFCWEECYRNQEYKKWVITGEGSIGVLGVAHRSCFDEQEKIHRPEKETKIQNDAKEPSLVEKWNIKVTFLDEKQK